MLCCRFSDGSLFPAADVTVHPLHGAGFGTSATEVDSADTLHEDQLIPKFQRVTICGEDASEVSTAEISDRLLIDSGLIHLLDESVAETCLLYTSPSPRD